VFKNLKLWRDRNVDGRTDEGEFLSLSATSKTLDLIFAFNLSLIKIFEKEEKYGKA